MERLSPSCSLRNPDLCLHSTFSPALPLALPSVPAFQACSAAAAAVASVSPALLLQAGSATGFLFFKIPGDFRSPWCNSAFEWIREPGSDILLTTQPALGKMSVSSSNSLEEEAEFQTRAEAGPL